MLSEGEGSRTHTRVDQECHGTALGRLALTCWLDGRKTLDGFGKASLRRKVQVRVASPRKLRTHSEGRFAINASHA